MEAKELIIKLNETHQNKYQYNIKENISYNDNIEVVCPKHGKFKQRMIRHLKGAGCKKCYHESRISKASSQFSDRASKIHQNKYDYSKTLYRGCSKKVEIICPKHGSFYQIPSSHLRGRGCLKCAGNQLCTIDEFVDKANRIHGNKYDYSQVKYLGNKIKVNIICPKHGLFKQTPNAHVQYGCKKCANEDPKNYYHVKPKPKQYFVNKSIEVHGNKYDYTKSNYKNCKENIEIICPKHGSFWQIPTNHYIQKHGCPRCSGSISQAQQDIADFVKQYMKVKLNDRTQLYPLEIDVWVPDVNVGIEFHGLYYHSHESEEIDYSHMIKADLAFEKSIKLIQIFEDEWIYKQDIVKSIIKSNLGVNHKIVATDCLIELLSEDDYKNFCEENHIKGYKSAEFRYGLYHNDCLVYIMSFSGENDKYKVERFCSKQNLYIENGGHILFENFINKHGPQSLSIFYDRRYDIGHMNMEVEKIDPKGFYVKGKNRNNIPSSRVIWDAGYYNYIYKRMQ